MKKVKRKKKIKASVTTVKTDICGQL